MARYNTLVVVDWVAREEVDRRRFIRGRRGFHLLGLFTIALGFALQPGVDAIACAGMMAMLVVAANVVTRGADAPPTSPDRARDVVRARARARLRLGTVLRVAIVVFGAITLALARREEVIFTAVFVAGLGVAMWVSLLAMERRIRRALE